MSVFDNLDKLESIEQVHLLMYEIPSFVFPYNELKWNIIHEIIYYSGVRYKGYKVRATAKKLSKIVFETFDDYLNLYGFQLKDWDAIHNQDNIDLELIITKNDSSVSTKREEAE